MLEQLVELRQHIVAWLVCFDKLFSLLRGYLFVLVLDVIKQVCETARFGRERPVVASTITACSESVNRLNQKFERHRTIFIHSASDLAQLQKVSYADSKAHCVSIAAYRGQLG